MDRLGMFKLVSDDPALEFEAIIVKPFVPTTGYGGWRRIARPRRRALTEWAGRDSVSMTGEFMLDNVDEGRGFELKQAIDTLERMAGVNKDDPEPPLVRLHSNPAPLVMHSFHHAAHVWWYVDGLAWDADAFIYNREGNPVRAKGTLVLTQHVEDERLQELSSVERRKRRKATPKKGQGKKGAKVKRYVVKSGDTLSSIAARHLGSARRWQEIAKLNGIRDPKAVKVGQTLRLP